ncbi:hypothetical protein K6U06_14230 [Acidiferrimicrobium sp. IK]|uniref:kelch repeat-containing protein n=1 Tax=Acidiferrimicrobium sp. IK TaxID=2871700 RepID=UPI0021CB0287|nr:kelch repeat-containing protein [Acidiferrimicrobium sp. IK]MCU4185526.1 hypothetical protein [Acidiferrimicrobium sp. IK]
MAGRLAAVVGVAGIGLLFSGPTAPEAAAAAPPSLTWTAMAVGSGPPTLRDPAVAYDSDIHAVVLFGGTLANGALSNQTWLFNGTTWSIAGGGPAARTGAAMAFDAAQHQLILFGGLDSTGAYLDDTWAWNGASWYLVTPRTSLPPGRQGAALAADPSGDLVLFGGTGAPPAASAGPEAPPTTAPAAGSSAAGAGMAAQGTAGATTLGDTWTWNGSAWSQANPPVSPPARTDASAAFDPVHNVSVLFGGTTTPDGSGAATPALSDTWTWNGATWAKADTAAGPSGRTSATFVGDPDVGGVLLSGGSAGGSSLNDTWAWTGTAWSELHPSGSPPSTAAAGAAYDAATGTVVIYGGDSTGGPPSAITYLLGRTSASPSGTPPAAPATTVAPPVTVPTVLGRSGGARATTTTTAAATSPTIPPRAAGAPATTTAPSSGGNVSAPPQTPTVERVRPGAPVLLIAAGFRPGATILVTFHSTPEEIGTYTADADGTFSATVTVPDGAAAGSHHFVMSGPGPAGSITISTPVLVVASAPAHHGIGLQTPIMVTIAVLLPLGTWLGLGVASRRRARAHPA